MAEKNQASSGKLDQVAKKPPSKKRPQKSPLEKAPYKKAPSKKPLLKGPFKKAPEIECLSANINEILSFEY